MIEVIALAHDGEKTPVSIDKWPDHCPICHSGIEALKQSVPAHVGVDQKVEIVFRCPRERCQSFFITRYYPFSYTGVHRYNRSVPFEQFDTEFSEHVQKISPQYCKIANEALKAEEQGFELIAGPGYRKALEFLVKDYLCLARPDDAERIKKVQLGPCIAQYVDHEKIKATAARAAWLGNDETHYERKWEEKDLEDLKKLIQLTVLWIEMEEMTASVIKEMPEGRK
jgi:hypothetical protein